MASRPAAHWSRPSLRPPLSSPVCASADHSLARTLSWASWPLLAWTLLGPLLRPPSSVCPSLVLSSHQAACPALRLWLLSCPPLPGVCAGPVVSPARSPHPPDPITSLICLEASGLPRPRLRPAPLLTLARAGPVSPRPPRPHPIPDRCAHTCPP